MQAQKPGSVLALRARSIARFASELYALEFKYSRRELKGDAGVAGGGRVSVEIGKYDRSIRRVYPPLHCPPPLRHPPSFLSTLIHRSTFLAAGDEWRCKAQSAMMEILSEYLNSVDNYTNIESWKYPGIYFIVISLINA